VIHVIRARSVAVPFTTSPQVGEGPGHRWLRDSQRLGPREPERVLTLVRRRRIAVVAVEEVTQIEVGVAAWPGMDVHVNEVRRPVGEAEMPKAGLLAGLADGCLPRLLVGVDVTARGTQTPSSRWRCRITPRRPTISADAAACTGLACSSNGSSSRSSWRMAYLGEPALQNVVHRR